MERTTVKARDGWPLAVWRLDPPGPSRGSVLALHAMMVDHRTLDRPRGEGLASVLVEHGLTVWLPDLRGHGESRRDGRPWAYDDLVRSDLPALAEAARDPRGLLILGHSLGGHTAAAAMGTGLLAADALILVAANVWMPRHEPSRRRMLRKGSAFAAFLATARAFGRFPTRRLRAGTDDEALPYVEDLCRFWREDAWRSRDGVDYLASLEGVRCPALQVLGAGDHLYGHEAGARAFTACLPDHEIWWARRGERGLAYDPGHMALVTDARSRPLWEAIAAWALDHLPTARPAQSFAPVLAL